MLSDTDAQKKAYILADNRMALDADWDEELLKIEIESLQGEDFNVSLTGFEEKEIASLFDTDTDAKEDNFDVDAELENPCISNLCSCRSNSSMSRYYSIVFVNDYGIDKAKLPQRRTELVYLLRRARQIQCERCISEYGFLAKHPTTGNAIASPYVSMLQQFTKQVNHVPLECLSFYGFVLLNRKALFICLKQFEKLASLIHLISFLRAEQPFHHIVLRSAKIKEGKSAKIIDLPDAPNLEGEDMPPVKDYMKEQSI